MLLESITRIDFEIGDCPMRYFGARRLQLRIAFLEPVTASKRLGVLSVHSGMLFRVFSRQGKERCPSLPKEVP